MRTDQKFWRLLAIGIGIALIPVAVALSIVSGSVPRSFLAVALAVLALVVLIVGPAVLVLSTVAIHELGHLLFGYAAGLKFMSLQIGPLTWTKIDGKPQFYWMGRGASCGGFAAMRMPEGKVSLGRWRMMLLGGPLANLAVAAACAWISAHYSIPFGFLAQRSPVELTVYLVFAVNFLMGVINLSPYKSRGRLTDGARLVLSWYGKDAALLLALRSELNASITAGVRARDWNHRLIEQLLAPSQDVSEHAGMLLIDFYYELDSGNRERALQRANEVFAEVQRKDRVFAGITGPLFKLEAAYALAWLAGDAATARSLLDELAAVPPPLAGTKLRAEAALAFAERRWHDAMDLAAKAINLSRKDQKRIRSNGRAEIEWNLAILTAARDNESNARRAAAFGARPSPADASCQAPPSHPEPASSPDPSG